MLGWGCDVFTGPIHGFGMGAHLFSMSALTALLNAFGALWLVVEIADFFFRDTTIPARLQALWWLFALSGVGNAFWRCRPRTSVAHRLAGRDVTVEIAVGNVFSFPGAMIRREQYILRHEGVSKVDL